MYAALLLIHKGRGKEKDGASDDGQAEDGPAVASVVIYASGNQVSVGNSFIDSSDIDFLQRHLRCLNPRECRRGNYENRQWKEARFKNVQLDTGQLLYALH